MLSYQMLPGNGINFFPGVLMKYENTPILMYHDISDIPVSWCVSPEDFRQQMLFLRENGYITITLDVLKEGIGNNQETNDKLIVITFDDARKGVYDCALPIIKEYSFTATLFIVPYWIENPTSMPMREMFSHFCNWENINEMVENGFTLGAHTYTHADLSTLDADQALEECINADRSICENTGITPLHFSYPFGKYSLEVREIIRQRYKTAVTVQKGLSKLSGEYARQWVLRETSIIKFQQLLSETFSI